MNPAIQTESLTKIYRGKKGKKIPALLNLNLEIKEGETFGFIGPNGAGKTTAIKILTGLAFPTSGKAFLFGKAVSDCASRTSLGYLSEVVSYSPYFDAEELLFAFGTIHGLSRVECQKRSRELLELVGLWERRKSRVGEFSKGMLQRLGIAVALLPNPSLLILDEPTSGLDPVAQREVLAILQSLKGYGITIFFSSHRLVEVEGLCDSVGVISLGDCIFHGTLSDLERKDTQTPFLIRFHSAPAISGLGDAVPRRLEENLYEVKVDRENLDRSIHRLHSQNAKIFSVVPQHSPLEDLFVRMIEEHRKGKTVS